MQEKRTNKKENKQIKQEKLHPSCDKAVKPASLMQQEKERTHQEKPHPQYPISLISHSLGDPIGGILRHNAEDTAPAMGDKRRLLL